jgi:hypothetical protein
MYSSGNWAGRRLTHMIKRDNFQGWQKIEALQASTNEVSVLWKSEFAHQSSAHYMCAFCRFVSTNKNYFEVDHLVSCKEGGNANRESLERVRDIQAELAKPLDRQDLGILSLANLNSQLLCVGCNQAKKGNNGPRPDFIPPGAGYAWAKADEDQNPEHRYSGPPPVIGYVPRRYRKNVTR